MKTPERNIKRKLLIIYKMTKPKLNLGKKEGTLALDNYFWIKRFENGIKLRKKKEGEITLNIFQIFEMLMYLRKYPKKFGNPIFLTSLDLTYVWQKYPETKDFIEKLLLDEITDKEKLKIHETYMTKYKIMESLED